MEVRWDTAVNLLRGGLSLPGVVVLWTGMWTFMDRHLPGGTGFGKMTILAAFGAWVMVWTRTLFSNAGMDALDHEGSLAEMGSLLARGRLQWRDKSRFYIRSLIAITGSIMFWDGVYTLCNDHAWANTPTYNLMCAIFGGIGMVWVFTSEDGQEDNDGIDGPVRLGVVRAAMEGRRPSGEFASLDATTKARLYAKALFCNVCAVVFWKGVEEMIEAGPDTNWTGVVFFVVGVVVLRGTERLSANSGLDDALNLNVELPSPNDSVQQHGTAAGVATKNAAFWGRGPSSTPFWPDLERNDSFDHWQTDADAAGARFQRCDCCPRWAVTTAELTGVVFAWSGVEWYIWDGDYIPDTWIRDVAYMVVGLTALLATRTFFNLAGMISPMAVLNQVHQHNLHEETVSLLASDEGLLPHTDSPTASSVDL